MRFVSIGVSILIISYITFLIFLDLFNLKVTAETISAFNFSNNKLTISTSSQIMSIEGASIIYIKDLATQEVLINTSAWINRPTISQGFTPTSSTVPTFQEISSTQGKLTYNIAGKGVLTLDINIDTSGEIVIQATGTGTGIPSQIDLPLMGSTLSSAILGSGAKYVRTDITKTDISNHGGFESPVMAILEGSNSVIATWPESTTLLHNNISLQHNQNTYDHLILQTSQDEKTKVTNPNTIYSAPWRIGTYSKWNLAAKRWKERFEILNNVKPLWQNTALWVRNVHSVYWGTNNSGQIGAMISKLKEMSIKPQSVLNFLWNGDRIAVFGDPRLANVIALPTQNIKDLMIQNQMPMILYHPWILIRTKENALSGVDSLKSHSPSWLPTNWTPQDLNGFRPDYDDSSFDSSNAYDSWLNYWKDISTCYYWCPGSTSGTAEDYILHPGSTKFKNYLVRNLSNYDTTHSASGSYLDVLGMDHGYMFPSTSFPNTPKVIEGQDFSLGESNAIKNFIEKVPNQAIMSEYLPQHLLGKVFATWEGAETHLSWYSSVTVNHPLRGALTGSYSWTRESNEKNTDETLSNMLGGLPEVSLVGDYNVGSDRALYSLQRAKLFTDKELFYDIPDNWDSEALAYYRSNTGNWFKYKKTGNNYSYVEETNGGDIVRLVSGGVYIPGSTPGSTITPVVSINPKYDLNGDNAINLLDVLEILGEIFR